MNWYLYSCEFRVKGNKLVPYWYFFKLSSRWEIQFYMPAWLLIGPTICLDAFRYCTKFHFHVNEPTRLIIPSQIIPIIRYSQTNTGLRGDTYAMKVLFADQHWTSWMNRSHKPCAPLRHSLPAASLTAYGVTNLACTLHALLIL